VTTQEVTYPYVCPKCGRKEIFYFQARIICSCGKSAMVEEKDVKNGR